MKPITSIPRFRNVVDVHGWVPAFRLYYAFRRVNRITFSMCELPFYYPTTRRVIMEIVKARLNYYPYICNPFAQIAPHSMGMGTVNEVFNALEKGMIN